MTGDILVIGVGNPDRADDGVGPLVVRQLPALPGVRALFRPADGCALIEDWADAGALILVDAASAASHPGRVHRIDLSCQPPPHTLRPSSTHALGVAEAIGLAQVIGCLPGRSVLYAIEGQCFGTGLPMTPEVAAAAPEVARRVAEEACSMRASA